MTTRALVAGGVRIVALVVVIFLAIEYLKLGDFVLFLLPLGALAAILLTRRQRAGYSRVWSSLVAVLAYAAAWALVWSAAVQNREEAREARWEIVDRPGSSELEVRLYIGVSEGAEGSDYLFSSSSELASYLRARSKETVPVLLPVTRVLGCFKSLGAPRIEGFGLVPIGGYTTVGGAGTGAEHWWCP